MLEVHWLEGHSLISKDLLGVGLDMERYAERDLLPGGREMPPQDMLGAPPSM